MNKVMMLFVVAAVAALSSQASSFDYDEEGRLVLFAGDGESVPYDQKLMGTTNVIKRGGGTVTLTGDNSDFLGVIVIESGILSGSNATGFGGYGDLVIKNGGALQITGGPQSTLNTRHILVEGVGPAGNGAIVRLSSDTSGNGDSIFKDITLTGDATINSGRRFGASSGTIDLSGYKLTKMGSAEFLLTKQTVKGGIVNAGTVGTFLLSGSELSDDVAGSKLLLGGNATLSMWNMEEMRASSWMIETTGTPAITMGSSATTWSGSILNEGKSLTFKGSANTVGHFEGDISGDGKVIVNTSGEIVLSGSNTYTGTTELTAGTLTVLSTNALPRFAEVGGVVMSGGKLVLDSAGWIKSDVERLLSVLTKTGGTVTWLLPVEVNADAPRVGRSLEVTNVGSVFGDLKFRWYRGSTSKTYDLTPIGTENAYTPTIGDYEHWIKCVIEDELCGFRELEFFVSKLPVVYMTTKGGKTPSSAKEGHTGHIRIQGNETWALQYDGDLDKVSVRGNSTAGLPKKPYKIKLGKKTSLFGIPKSKHWVLLANYLDESNMRNKIAYDLSGEMGLTYMRSTWVDVILNGEWLGLYQLCEHIRVDSERVDVYDWEGAAEDLAAAFAKKHGLSSDDEDLLIEQLQHDYSWVTNDSVTFGEWTDAPSTIWKDYSNDISGGYLFELSSEYDELSQFTIGVRSGLEIKTMVNAPEYLFSNPIMMDYCKDFWQNYWSACASATGYNSAGRHYSELSDIDSMVAYWLMMEVMGNNDASSKSRYAYKDKGGKLIWGPVWDFDWGVGGPVLRKAVTDSETGEKYWEPADATGWKVSQNSFYKDWVDDPWLCLKGYEKYWAMRAKFAAIVETNGLIDQYADYLSEAGDANEAKWKYRIGFGGADGDVAGLKTYLTDRLSWLDEQFASVETLMKSLKMNNSGSPYQKDDSGLALQCSAVKSNVVCTTDYFLSKGDDASFVVTVKNSTARMIDIYLDGLKYGNAVIENGSCEVRIPAEDIDLADEGRRMVQFVALNSGQSILARNYATFLVETNGEGSDDPIPDNVFLPTGTGRSWDVDENWARGYYPNGTGERALIGVPTEAKKKGYRTIHIAEHTVTVGVVEVTNGGWTNRIDNDISGDLVFDGGLEMARLVVTDADDPGLLMLDLSDRVILNSDLVCSISNTMGSVDYGGLLVNGLIVGNGKNLKKNGPGRMTIRAMASESADVIGKLQIEEGIVAVESALHVGSVTKEGTLWLRLGGEDCQTSVEDAMICDEKISVDHVALFAPTRCGGVTCYGGAVAKSVMGKSTTVVVYVRDSDGPVSFCGHRWRICAGATVSAQSCGGGRQTYKVEIPFALPPGGVAPASGVTSVTVSAMTPDEAVSAIRFVPPTDQSGQSVVSPDEYAGYFRVTAMETGVAGYYQLSVALEDSKIQPMANVALTELSDLLSGGSEECEISALPGLYYSILSTGALDADFIEGQRQLATGRTMRLLVPRMGSSGFYKIRVSASRVD